MRCYFTYKFANIGINGKYIAAPKKNDVSQLTHFDP